MPCHAHALVCTVMDGSRAHLVTIHECIFQREGHVMIHRARLVIASTQKLVGMEDGGWHGIEGYAIRYPADAVHPHRVGLLRSGRSNGEEGQRKSNVA